MMQGSKLLCHGEGSTALCCICVQRETRHTTQSICLKAKKKKQQLDLGCLQRPTGCDLQEASPAALPATAAADAAPAARHFLHIKT